MQGFGPLIILQRGQEPFGCFCRPYEIHCKIASKAFRTKPNENAQGLRVYFQHQGDLLASFRGIGLINAYRIYQEPLFGSRVRRSEKICKVLLHANDSAVDEYTRASLVFHEHPGMASPMYTTVPHTVDSSPARHEPICSGQVHREN
jgi:hypothetical protein